MYYCLFPPIASLRPVPPWLQSEFQPSAIKYASLSACGAFAISNQQMPPTPFFHKDRKLSGTEKLNADGREIKCNGFQRVPLKLHTNTHLSLCRCWKWRNPPVASLSRYTALNLFLRNLQTWLYMTFVKHFHCWSYRYCALMNVWLYPTWLSHFSELL